MDKEYFKKHVDEVFLPSILLCNEKGLVTVDCCAGLGKITYMSGRTNSKTHLFRDFPYVTFLKKGINQKAFDKFCSILKRYSVYDKYFEEKLPLFRIEGLKKDVGCSCPDRKLHDIPPKYRIGITNGLIEPIFNPNVNKIEKSKYKKKLYNVKKRWHKLFYEAIEEI